MVKKQTKAVVAEVQVPEMGHNRHAPNPFLEQIDKAHLQTHFFNEPISFDVWRDKYKWHDDNDITDMCWRVANAVNIGDGSVHIMEAYHAMVAGLWMPAGRILAGAGTGKRVTLINCFVNADMPDELAGIQDCMKNTALTMQQGGGMGSNFSTLRPENAVLKRTHSKASGPLPFMDEMNQTSKTIRSAGDRRGAMMGTMCDTHPDLPKFIIAKRTKGRLQEFNVSVLVSDALMEAITDDEEWLLHFSIPPFGHRDPKHVEKDFDDNEGVKQYVYSIWRARDLWDLITSNTYEWSEPGIIFIDRVNALNNLQHIEDIQCTNPCGEQPLPPHGACDLGHVNLARLVKYPFTAKAEMNWELLREVVRVGQRFLDNVLDITGWPLPEQEIEGKSKRRTGLGITGLADAMMQMRLRYGSPRSVDFADRVMREVCYASYIKNVELAEEKGKCDAFDPSCCDGTTFIAQRLAPDFKERIRKSGLRNGVGLTVAPTGTISVVYGNLDGSGCECAFAHVYDRKVRQPSEGNEDVYKTYEGVRGYTHRLWESIHGDDVPYPSYFVTSQDLSVEEHISVQAAVQRWTDASVSKTVNCPKEMAYGEFKKVYELAYAMGCKGCTTYRPSDVRGSILSIAGSGANEAAKIDEQDQRPPSRPEILRGYTYQVKWASRKAALYITLNEDENGDPAEILIASKDSSDFEWVTSLTLMITAIFKKGGNISFVAEELKQIQSVNFGWVDGKMYGSLPAYIGHILERHFKGGANKKQMTMEESTKRPPKVLTVEPPVMMLGDTCPECKAPTVLKTEGGCKKCQNCTWSSC